MNNKSKQEISSDENDDEEVIFGDKYSGSEYSTDSSSTNPPRKRSRLAPQKKSNNALVFNSCGSKELINLETYSDIENDSTKSFKSLYYFESCSSDESDTESTKSSLVTSINISWEPVTGNNMKLFKFSKDIEISTSVYHNYRLKTPYDFFKLLVNDEIVTLMVTETNRYAQQCKDRNSIKDERINEWYDTDNREMEIFLGILMFMILTLLPSLKSYWEGMQEHLYRSKVIAKMKRERFRLLMKMWHFNNNDIPSEDRMRKLSPLLSLLEKNFQNAIIPGEKLYIDESVIPFRRGFKTKYRYQFGLRCVNLCLSNGYTYKMSIYFGRDLELKNVLPSHVVLTLMKGLLGEGRIVFTKEHYTSVALAHELLKNKTHLVGPLNAKRDLNPKNIVKSKLKKGESFSLESNTGIIIQKWKNPWNSDVLVLSTKYNNEMVIKFDKKGKITEPPRAIAETAACTSKLFCDSFDKMLEQMEEYHVRLSRRMKWYRRLAIEFLIQTTLINAHILHQEVTNESMDLLDFRKNVTNTLLSMDGKNNK